jgi:Tfp pilus assembly protein PilE
MMKKEIKSFTLIELILVVIMVIILSAVGIVSYNKSKQKAIQKEGIANVRLIAAAERIYHMETGGYVACGCTDATDCAANAAPYGCNYILKLNLNTTNWNYAVAADGTITASGGCAISLPAANYDDDPACS